MSQVSPNVLDRAIASFSPGWAAARARSRLQLRASMQRASAVDAMAAASASEYDPAYRSQIRMAQQILARGYDVGSPSANINPRALQVGDPNTDVGNALDRATRLVKDLLMNDAMAIKAIGAYIDLIHGSGIQPQSDTMTGMVTRNGREPGAKAFERKDILDDLWNRRFYEWAYDSTGIDYEDTLNFDGLTELGERAKAVSGNALYVLHWHTRREVERLGLVNPLRIEVLDSAWLNTKVKSWTDPNSKAQPPKKWPVIQGIEFDPDTKKRRAYHMFASDPSTPNPKTIRVDAKYVIHDFHKNFPQQQIGISQFAPIVHTLYDLNNAADAGMKRLVFESAICLVLEVPDGADAYATGIGTYGLADGTEDDGAAFARDPELYDPSFGMPRTARGKVMETITPGSITRVPKGVTPHSISPTPSGGMLQVVANASRRIAAALGLTYEGLTGDYKNVNYSSGRLADLPAQRKAKRRRQEWINRVGQPIVEAFTIGCYMMNSWGFEGYFSVEQIRPGEVDWIMPQRDSADPLKDALANSQRLDNGEVLWIDLQTENGKDARQVMKRLAQQKRMAKQFGVEDEINAFTFSRNKFALKQTDDGFLQVDGTDTGDDQPPAPVGDQAQGGTSE